MPVLAMYDIRGKQEFIFRSRSLKEIVGGSAIIRDCFLKYLFPVVEEDQERFGKGIYHEYTPFSGIEFEKRIKDGYIGEVIYEGGGNFILLMKDREIFQDVTYAFTKKIMKEIGTLRVLGTCVEINSYDDYEKDQKRLYEAHRRNEYQENIVMPWGTLPVVQVDTRTSFPLTDMRWDETGSREKVSRESLAKHLKYKEELSLKTKDDLGVLVLDNLVTEKGKDSLLAVVYIDGNNMGYKVQECCMGKKTYEECIAALRTMSAGIQKDYLDDRKEEIDTFLREKHKADAKKKGTFRLVIGAGDEINIICNAHDAFEVATNYLKKLPAGDTSCAGIAIFHSHAPYSDVYRIAEECCESGKTRMKELGLKDVSLLDFHYCQGSIDVSLEQIREKESEEDISRPWMITGKAEKDGDIEELETVLRLKRFLNQLGRSNVKGLGAVAKSSRAELEQELNRIHAHLSDEKKTVMKADWDFVYAMDPERRRKLIYDVVIVYDLWFRE